MSASTKISAPAKYRYQPKTYFTWGKRLYYVVDISQDGEMVFVEDCKTERVRWMKTDLFKGFTKEVIPSNAS